MVSPRSNERNIGNPIPEPMLPIFERKRQSLGTDLKNRGKRDDVVVPEDGLEFWKVGLGKIRARVYRAIVHPADFERQRIGLRRNEKIRSQAAELFCQPVPHIERNTQRRGGYAHTESQRRPGEKLVSRASSKGIGNKSQEHWIRGSP